MVRLDHVMIRTTDMEKSVEFYQTIFGMVVDSIDPHPEDNYDLTFLKDLASDMKIELTYNYGVDSYEAGNLFGHISFYVDNAIERIELAEKMGYETRHREHKSTFDKKYIIGVIKSPEGIEIAIVEKLSS